MNLSAVLYISASIFLYSCGTTPGVASLENNDLKLELSSAFPAVTSYYYKPASMHFDGADSKGWEINDRFYSWDKWNIRCEFSDSVALYKMEMPALEIAFEYKIKLTADAVNISLGNVSDPKRHLKKISWGNTPLISVKDSSINWWAKKSSLYTHWVKEKKDNRGLWGIDELRGRTGTEIPATETIDACIWNDKFVAGLISNDDLFPVNIHADTLRGIKLSLNSYHHSLAGHVMPDFEATLVFLADQNADMQINNHDYLLWKNRRLKDADPILTNTIAYKVFMDAPFLKQPSTTLNELDKIVKRIYNITDGLPQVVYMVGWQYEGHDTGYPSIDKWNERLGPHADVFKKSDYYRDSLNTCLSYHINIDDAYKSSKDFTPEIMSTDYDGSPMYWQVFKKAEPDSAFHISHYKDVKTGNIFKRLETFLQTVPVQKVLHIDAMRTINCNPQWEKDSIGVREELSLGLKPILHWLNGKGIALSTEGQNGMPNEITGLVGAVWHLSDPSAENLIAYHRKTTGGGWNDGRGRLECGLGTSIHHDISYKKSPGVVNINNDWDILKERIFLGSILYTYYLERELTNVEKTDDKVVMKFADSTLTMIDIKNDHLLVKCKDMTIALDDDRFVPSGKSVYAFSREGSNREWVLPPSLSGKKLHVFTLTKEGRGPAPRYTVSGNRIRIDLPKGVPVKMELAGNN